MDLLQNRNSLRHDTNSNVPYLRLCNLYVVYPFRKTCKILKHQNLDFKRWDLLEVWILGPKSWTQNCRSCARDLITLRPKCRETASPSFISTFTVMIQTSELPKNVISLIVCSSIFVRFLYSWFDKIALLRQMADIITDQASSTRLWRSRSRSDTLSSTVCVEAQLPLKPFVHVFRCR